VAAKNSKCDPVLKPRFRVVCGETIALGPGKIELLALLVETESLNQAARQLGMSYMRAWKLIKVMNACFREPVAVATRGGQTGGGMRVTVTGHRALACYRQMESSALHSASKPWKELRGLLKAD
jgi:molybdate transport system regulatory protein